jgi:hypothetical protein
MKRNGFGSVPVLSGRGRVHRRLDQRQFACIGAKAAEGSTKIDWSVARLAAALKVSRQSRERAPRSDSRYRQACRVHVFKRRLPMMRRKDRRHAERASKDSNNG